MGTYILSGATAYISTSIDYLVVLMLIFNQATSKKQRIAVYFGDLVGTALLVFASWLLAYILHFIPDAWLLGLLGIIPIAMGVQTLFSGSKDKGEVADTLAKHRNLIVNVAIITIVTCGADNIGIYVPFFVTLSASAFIVVLLTFLVMLTLFCVAGYWLDKLPFIGKLLNKYGKWITAIVYIALGVFIMLDSGTIAKLISFF